MTEIYLFMCVYLYVYVYVYAYIYMYVCVCMYVRVCMFVCVVCVGENKQVAFETSTIRLSTNDITQSVWERSVKSVIRRSRWFSTAKLDAGDGWDGDPL